MRTLSAELSFSRATVRVRISNAYLNLTFTEYSRKLGMIYLSFNEYSVSGFNIILCKYLGIELYLYTILYISDVYVITRRKPDELIHIE